MIDQMPDHADPKRRFSNRVADYVRFRPGYPTGVLEAVAEVTGLPAPWEVADLGSGTGISAALFLEAGHRVAGVEPNPEMRNAAEQLLGDHPAFLSMGGSAEATGLPDRSVDLVVAGQAFHWFSPPEVRRECLRILCPPGWAVLMWNVRRTDADDFSRGYEALLERWGTDYRQYRARRIDAEELRAFFGGLPAERSVPNGQTFDFEGLRGRHLSSSYVPAADQEGYEPMMRELRELFDDCHQGGQVRFEYDTQVFVARLV